MQQVIQVKLQTTAEQFSTLKTTLDVAHRAARLASRIALEMGAARQKISGEALQRVAYRDVKAAGLSAQPAIHVCRKVAAADATLRTNLRNGNYGKPGSKRRSTIASQPVSFRPEAAQPFDDRCLSWQHDAGTISIWTVGGRMKDIGFAGEAGQMVRLRKFRKGETDLVIRNGCAYLVATLEVREPPVHRAPSGWLGVDLGIVNIATTSDGDHATGAKVIGLRQRQRRLRRRLQKKDTQSALRLLKKRAQKEARFAADVNHPIAKKIVTEAQRTGRGIALEDLTGIRARVRLRQPQRVRLPSWSFAQLGFFLADKARWAGVPLLYVDPSYTAQTCHACGNVDSKSRVDQSTYPCTACGVVAHADVNAALNIAHRGAPSWAAVSQPYAA